MMTRTELRTLAGFRRAMRNPITRDWVVVYSAFEQGIDADGARWAVACNAHGSILACETLDLAVSAAREAAEWCEVCRDAC